MCGHSRELGRESRQADLELDRGAGTVGVRTDKERRLRENEMC